jgi:hypothetical protein
MAEVAQTSPGANPEQAPAADVTPQEAHIMMLDRHEVYLAWAGIISAFVLSLAFLGCSTWLIAQDHDMGGTILGTIDLVALVTVFVTRQHTGAIQRRNHKKQNRPAP